MTTRIDLAEDLMPVKLIDSKTPSSVVQKSGTYVKFERICSNLR